MKTVKSTDLPIYDFSNDKSEVDEIKEAIEQAEKAMSAPSASKPLVPTKKAAKKSGKAGRIVGISKGENELLQNLLSKIADDENYAMIVENESFAKIQARYNK